MGVYLKKASSPASAREKGTSTVPLFFPFFGGVLPAHQQSTLRTRAKYQFRKVVRAVQNDSK